MSNWRAKQYRVNITATRQLVITVRRFKTSPVSRAQSFRQLVIPIDTTRVKEIALRFQTHKRASTRTLNPKDFWRLRAAAPLLMLVIGVIGMTLFGSQLLLKPHSVEPIKTFTVPKTVHVAKVIVRTLPASMPTEITIPSVNIDANIIPVGKASDGSIQMPPILSWETGWYQYSPMPGQIGPAVIVGHVDNYENISVFWRLRYVQPGALINITRADGSVAIFKVTSLQQYDQNSFPTATVYGNTPYPELRVITCGGTFDTATGSYDENTVVYATLIN